MLLNYHMISLDTAVKKPIPIPLSHRKWLASAFVEILVAPIVQSVPMPAPEANMQLCAGIGQEQVVRDQAPIYITVSA